MIIKFEKVDDIINFVERVSRLNYEIDLKKGRYIIPADSMMAIFAIGASNEFELIIHSNDNNIVNNFKEWSV